MLPNQKENSPPRDLKKDIPAALLMLLTIPLAVVSSAIATTAGIVVFFVALAIGLIPLFVALHLGARSFFVVFAALAAPLVVYIVFRTRLGRASIELTDL